MAISGLLDITSPGFEFDHDQLHRQMLYAQSPGAQTTLLDPMADINVPAGWFTTDHVIAHQQFANAFPAASGPSTVPINDINLNDGSTEIWALSNRVLHNIARSVLPANA